MFHRLFLAALLLLFATTLAFASGYERPIPQPQTAATESWFALASLLLCVALYIVHRVVRKR